MRTVSSRAVNAILSYTASKHAQARARQPCATHPWSRSWAVDLGPNNARGHATHRAPVRAPDQAVRYECFAICREGIASI